MYFASFAYNSNFGNVYSGMVRSKNTLNTIMNCFIAFGVITLQWVVLGFSFSFGKDEGLGLVGNFENFLLEGISGYNASGVSNILFMIFQMMFALIASAIITGSLVGRIKLGVLVIFLLFWSTLVYDVLAHMIWSSEGFLLKRGSLDFAGGGVVYISSGVAGLVGALIVGARKSDDEDKNAHSISYAFLGVILLFIGWLGFNAGSAGEMNDIAINAFIVSIISAACGFLSWVVLEGSSISTERIFEELWDYDEEPSELSLRAYVKNLRKILGKEKIINQRGRGYCYG